jgi:CHASE2 domain-containing sensor protein
VAIFQEIFDCIERKSLPFLNSLLFFQSDDVKVNAFNRILFNSVAGALLTALCGLTLWCVPFGEAWTNASYDYSFRFGSRPITNRVCLVMMDNEAYDQFHQTRGQPWDRALHARLLNKLADDGCALVVMDCFFREPHDHSEDVALADAIRRLRHIVLMAEPSPITHSTFAGVHLLVPSEPFYSAAGMNSGIAWIDPDPDLIVRRHWPFPAPGPYPSLPEVAARLANAPMNDVPQEKWLRYYGRNGEWTRLSYGSALIQPADYFRGRIVFIGTQPKTSILDRELDEFCTPYTRWTGETAGGVDIMITEFLNLVNGEWLRRAPSWAEALILALAGALLGGSFCRMRLWMASLCAFSISVAVLLAAVSCSYFTNYWGPWLTIAAGQVPCALGWAWLSQRAGRLAASSVRIGATQAGAPTQKPPEIPGCELFNPPIGEGAYGKVWLARNAKKEWRAVKVVYLGNFNNDPAPYEREFKGITRYQPISDKHPGLLGVEFVSPKLDGHFYYLMELGDPLVSGWEKDPSTYKPHDLGSERARAQGQRLTVRECVRIGLTLSDALDFLHRQGLTHRDIKPKNIIFVDGKPKMADLGLITEIRPPDQERTNVGTPGYMPPPPELPGTPQADIYALGIMLYVLSTGRQTAFFPEVSTTLVGKEDSDFLVLNPIILKACQPDPAQRYSSALEMCGALQEAQSALERAMPGQPR